MHRTRLDTDLNPPETTASPSAPADTVDGRRLYGRRTECQALDRLIADVRESQSRVLIIRGEAGAGKTALIDDAVGSAAGMRVTRIAGAEAEMEASCW